MAVVDNPILDKAISHHLEGDLNEADELYTKLLKKEPNHSDILHLSGIISYQKGELETAFILIDKAISLAPYKPDIHNSLGLVLEATGEHEKAVTEYSKSIDFNPYYVEALTNLARLEPDCADIQFNLGIALFLNGQYGESIRAYIKVLQIEPDRIEASNNIGLALYHLNKFDASIEIYKVVLHQKPDYAEAYNNLGLALIALGERDLAITNYQKAIQLKGDFVSAHYNLGCIFQSSGQIEDAMSAYQKVLSLKSDYSEAWYRLGYCFQIQGQIEEAINTYQKSIFYNSNFADVYINLGCAYKEKKQLDAAIDSYKNAIQIKPDLVSGYQNLGCAMLEKGYLDDAIQYFEIVTSLDSGNAEAFNNLGTLYSKKDAYDIALKKYTQTVRLDPNHAGAFYNIAKIFQNLKRFDEAIDYYKRAVSLKPDFVDAHVNLAFLLLLKGDFVSGWIEYEWRFQREDWKNTYPLLCDVPRWDGSPFKGKRLLVQNEQGLGDTIQLIRFLPIVKALGGTVVFEAEEALLDLLRNFDGIDELVQFQGKVSPKEIDYYIYLFSIPLLFGTKIDTIPKNIPYLQPNHEKQTYWKKRLSGDYFKVGLVWSGNPLNKDNCFRSCDLEKFAPLSEITGIRLYGLQKGEASYQVRKLPPSMEVISLGEELYDFSDTAGVIANLDLVIAVDTAVVHLAGAMGKLVWNLRYDKPYWVWLLEREDTPWYPTMRIFRQEKLNRWEAVIKHVKKELSLLVEAKK